MPASWQDILSSPLVLVFLILIGVSTILLFAAPMFLKIREATQIHPRLDFIARHPRRTRWVLICSAFVLGVLFILYAYGWGQSRFKCVDLVRPVLHPLDSQEQVAACTSFKDLNNFKVIATKGELDKIIKERAKSDATIDYSVAQEYALGRAKIREYAKEHDIFVSDEEISEEVTLAKSGGREVYLNGFSMVERRAQVEGYLLQKKVQAKAVTYKITDYVALRWDVVKPEVWQPKVAELKEEAKRDLLPIKNALLRDLSPREAVGESSADQTKFGFNLGTNQRLTKANTNAGFYQQAFKLPNGVSDPFCDNRVCVVFRILGGNNGEYDSMDEFLGGLKGW